MAYNPGTNIVVSGKTFMDVPAVQFKTPNGATVNFAHVGGQIRFSPTLEEQTEDVANYQDVIINPITSTLLNQLDSDFVAENIKKDVDLFGLLGTMEAGGGGGIVKGTFTLATAQGDYGFAEIEDNKLNPPDVILLYKTDYTEGDYSWLIAASVKIADKFYQVALRNTSNLGLIRSSTSDLFSSECIRITEFPRPAHLSCYMGSYYMQPGTYEYMYYWF